MACVGKKVVKYSAGGSLMVNNCAFPTASPTTTTTKFGHQLTVARGLQAHNLSPHIGTNCVSSGTAISCVQKRHRTTFSSRQLKVLEDAFEQNNYPCPAFREQIASRANLDLSRVQVWFQNRRAKHKKQMNQAMRCFAAAAAAASSTASVVGPQYQGLPQPLIYQPPPAPSDFSQQNHLQLPETENLQLTSPYNSQQHEPPAHLLSSHLEHQNVYSRSPNALSHSHSFTDSNTATCQLIHANQHIHLTSPNESYLYLQHQQHQLQQQQQQQEAEGEQQDLSASSFGDAEGNFRHILNTASNYATHTSNSFAKLNLAQQTGANQSSVVFDSLEAGGLDQARTQPRQQTLSHSTPLRDSLEYLY